MRLVVLGLSLSSSWGNGHATTYRALLRAFAARGHDVTVVHDEDSYLILGGKPGVEGAPDGVRRIGLRATNGFLSNLLTQQMGRAVCPARTHKLRAQG